MRQGYACLEEMRSEGKTFLPRTCPDCQLGPCKHEAAERGQRDGMDDTKTVETVEAMGYASCHILNAAHDVHWQLTRLPMWQHIAKLPCLTVDQRAYAEKVCRELQLSVACLSEFQRAAAKVNYAMVTQQED